jgi:UDP-glucose 4-epimerase
MALKGEPLTVHGDGKQVRAFCYVGDLVDALVIGMKKTRNDVFNIGNSKEPVTIGELAKIVVKETKSKSKIVSVSEDQSGRGRKKDIYHRIPDTGKAKRELGFEAKTSLREGIKMVAASIRGR